MCWLRCSRFSLGIGLFVLSFGVLAAGCGKPKKPIVAGSETSEQIIVAQHLEQRLQQKIERRLGLGGEAILYQAILTGEVTIYHDYGASLLANF